ncbi:MAG: Smr/MutS family protein [Bacilli bacterium]|jgi:DNA mismatch repair protein MutS2|nr:Smr/MutS family protein [Bacilli bacterium]MDD4344610.1 Smr/MutS family protein [Bacilli bacterium]MDD4520504.1 Smr/MutS family protein [Bacilli bacterium]MDY0399081.1 Smr/MutS family protein [Bacilli bacterium]
MKDYQLVLEFDRLKKIIAENTHTERGRELILALTWILDHLQLDEDLHLTAEMLQLVFKQGQLLQQNSADLRPFLTHALKGGVLTPRELNLIAHDIKIAGQLISLMKKMASSYQRVQNLVNQLVDLKPVASKIDDILTPSLGIRDNASAALSAIRKKLSRVEATRTSKINQLAQKYQDLLSDTLLTLRDGHYVLPVKTSEKNRINGIVFDVSSSGSTTFIEPDELVVLDNEIIALTSQEKEEINRILRLLTAEVVKVEPVLETNNALLATLDFYQAKALYGTAIDGYIATISSERELILRGARHPLIDSKKVVANDFILTPEQRIIVISGPNAGGKTVALKTVGLLVLMHHTGLPLPTKDVGKIPYFDHLYVDIGDAQSLSDNLSTFSGHIANLLAITSAVKKNDLVLLDELGTGTDPKEGEALAVALIEYLRIKGAYGLISSHFSGLKSYALTTNGITNGAMLFDESNLTPTYRLQVGLPGNSYGLEVARRLGLSLNIIHAAEDYLKTLNPEATDTLLNQLTALVREQQKLVEDNQKTQSDLAKEQARLAMLSNNFDERKRNFLSEVEEEKAAIINQAKVEADQILATLKSQTTLKAHQVIAAKKALDDLVDHEEEITTNENVSIGNFVTILGLFVEGEVKEIRGDKLTILARDGKSYQVAKNRVSVINQPNEKETNTKAQIDYQLAAERVPLELNVIGFHVDEALESVASYLDKCRLKRYQSVRIIHGGGTGALRNAIHLYLKAQSFVKEFHLGGQTDGGSGATIVVLL